VRGTDLIVLGCQSARPGQAVLGAVARAVLLGAPSTVAVLVNRGVAEDAEVAVVFHGSEDDEAALDLARRLAEASGRGLAEFDEVAPTDRERLLFVGAGRDDGALDRLLRERSESLVLVRGAKT
jgi:nucleotide-binding universal stress UspA family protein